MAYILTAGLWEREYLRAELATLDEVRALLDEADEPLDAVGFADLVLSGIYCDPDGSDWLKLETVEGTATP